MAKRSQIEVGQEWAYQRSRDHYIGNYGYQKAVIVAVEPYEQRTYGGIRKTSKGQGVLVELVGWNEQKFQKVVQLSQLWKLWGEFEVERAAYDAAKVISDAQNAIIKAEREKFNAEVYQPALREFQKIAQEVSGKYVSGYDRIDQLPIEVLQAIINALKVDKVA